MTTLGNCRDGLQQGDMDRARRVRATRMFARRNHCDNHFDNHLVQLAIVRMRISTEVKTKQQRNRSMYVRIYNPNVRTASLQSE